MTEETRDPITDFGILHCLRCGEKAVLVNFLFARSMKDVIDCQRCSAQHFLRVRDDRFATEVRYERYTRRYPPEFYDDDPDVTVMTRGHHAGSADGDRDETFSGPIQVYKRKKNFSDAEKEHIWTTSGGECHLCKKPWKLEEHSRYGWHIEHVIPNIGGGRETEQLENFKVGCASCNLRKGRGYSAQDVQDDLEALVEKLPRWRSLFGGGRVTDVAVSPRRATPKKPRPRRKR